MTTLILIPARLASTRLPNKPLADICGLPMIERTRRQAEKAGLGRVVVATDSREVFEIVEGFGGDVVMTREDHPSGSDRIHEAATIVDPVGASDVIVNVQGDFPDLDPAAIQDAAALMDDPAVDIGTLAAVIDDDYERTASNVVKAIGSPLASRLAAIEKVEARDAGALVLSLKEPSAPLLATLHAALDEVETTIEARDASRLVPYPYLRPSRVSNSIHV